MGDYTSEEYKVISDFGLLILKKAGNLEKILALVKLLDIDKDIFIKKINKEILIKILEK